MLLLALLLFALASTSFVVALNAGWSRRCWCSDVLAAAVADVVVVVIAFAVVRVAVFAARVYPVFAV